MSRVNKNALDDEENKSDQDVNDVESEMDPTQYRVEYQINTHQSPSLSALLEFLSDKNLIREKGDRQTNIINRIDGKCYFIPEPKINHFFKLYEICRRDSIGMMFAERQQEMSGIVFDFDIYQDKSETQLTNEIFSKVINRILNVLQRIIKFSPEYKSTLAITTKPKVLYNDDLGCYKDGFHIIIPSIQISRAAKKLVIEHLIKNDHMDLAFKDVEPTKKKINKDVERSIYTRNDYLDKMSATVPIFLIGSSTKYGSPPYVLNGIYNFTIEPDQITITNDTRMFEKIRKYNSINLTQEFSVNNYLKNSIGIEGQGKLIKKEQFELTDKYKLEEKEYAKVNASDHDLISNQGILSMYAVTDVQVHEIKNLLDLLHKKRADDYNNWFKILCILASTSQNYKALAEYFSRKSEKFNMVDFEKYWRDALINGPKSNLTLGTLHYLAKLDNKEGYEIVRKQSVFNIVYEKIYQNYRDGKLNHYDIAEILYVLLRHKFVTDIPEEDTHARWFEFMTEDDARNGEAFKWHMCKKEDKTPTALSHYISTVLPRLFDSIIQKIKERADKATGIKYYKEVLKNFKNTTFQLGIHSFKLNIIREAEIKFANRGFAEQLDKNPFVRGVRNGILVLSPTGEKPVLIRGYHNYPISKYTNAPYIPFNPFDPLTKKILCALRNMFPDNEPDSFELIMNFLASTIDGEPKDSIFFLIVGRGSNGKSFLTELHKNAIGEQYYAKMEMAFLTSFANMRGSATPDLMKLRDASLAVYSESNQSELLNMARIKELTGQETIAARGLFKDMVNFKPKCHHLATTNNDFMISSNDFGSWRRIWYYIFKIMFLSKDHPDIRLPNRRVRDGDIQKQWPHNPEINGRYLGILVWFHYFYYTKYGGSLHNINAPHIKFDTEQYKMRQDNIRQFMVARLVKTADPNYRVSLLAELVKYYKWYSVKYPGYEKPKDAVSMFFNTEIEHNIESTRQGAVLVGRRFLAEDNEQLQEGETMAIENAYILQPDENNFGIKTETTEQFYNSICEQYLLHKHIFEDPETYNFDADVIKFSNNSANGNNVANGNSTAEEQFKPIAEMAKKEKLKSYTAANDGAAAAAITQKDLDDLFGIVDSLM